METDFHSQHEIEKYIQRYLPPWKIYTPGHFLEIGAWDGELISQTAWLERQRGWSGICVDPFPRGFDRRTCQVCARAVSKDGLPREFVKVTIDRRNGGDVSYFSGFKENVTAHWELISQHCEYEIIHVPTITIPDLYKTYNLPRDIDFLSVDTEGSEVEIFDSIDFDIYHFGMIVFEHNEDLAARGHIGLLLVSAGYAHVESLRMDDIYVFRDLL
jgi:FkbM family methyltransferase